jgi:hypothetical protein
MTSCCDRVEAEKKDCVMIAGQLERVTGFDVIGLMCVKSCDFRQNAAMRNA